jgi:hypothetical protein
VLTGYHITARLDRQSAIWNAFSQSGRLEVRTGAHVTVANADSAEQAQLGRLWNTCE